MTPEVTALLAKAHEKLRVAELLLQAHAWDDAASRAYYAAYHAVSALHLSRGNSFSSHARSIGQFNKDFVQTGIFPREYTAILSRLFEDRQSGDYDVVDAISEDEARLDVTDAAALLAGLQSHLTG